MPSFYLKFAILLLLLATPALAGADLHDEFAAANSSYESGDFEGAYSGYEKLVGDGHLNSDLLYNLGNASFRLGRVGEAVLWYERALILDPSHIESRQNLQFLKRTGGLLQFDRGNVGSFLASTRSDDLLLASTITGWLAAIGIAAAITLRLRRQTKSVLWILNPIFAVVAVTAGTGFYLKRQNQARLSLGAIVTTPDSKAFTSPARAATPVIDLPAGSQVALVSKRGSWDYVDIPGKLRGWVPQETVTPLWPYGSDLAD